MNKINFVNSQLPALNATNLNQMQENFEESAVIISQTEPTTNEKVWLKKDSTNGNTIYAKNENGEFEEFVRKCENKSIFSGSCAVGDTINVTESILNFKFVLLAIGGTASYVTIPVSTTTTALRGSTNYIGANELDIMGISAVRSSDGNQFTLSATNCVIFKSGAIYSQGNNINNTIKEIIGVR